MFDTSLKESLLEIPDLPNLLRDLHETLDDEQRRRMEFREWLTEDIKAEFIFGQVVMHSPAAHEHNEANGQLYRAASLYADVKKLGKVRIGKALVGMTRNDYEPDVAFWKKEDADQFSPKMNVYPIPDLVVEVLSPGSVNIRRDTKTKFEDYASHGVAEYWIIDPDKKTVEQYLLIEGYPGGYELQRKVGIDDSIESVEMQGFKIPVRAIFEAEANAQAMAALLHLPL